MHRTAHYLLLALTALALAACADDPSRTVPDGSAPRDAAGDRASTSDGSSMDGAGTDGASPDASALDATDEPADPDAGTDAAPEALAPADAQPDGCTPGARTCAAADRQRTCLPDGGYEETDCPAGQVCAEGLGCLACEPGARRCNADGLTLEQCAMDGTGWAMLSRCDSAMGQACDGYRCVNLCARAQAQRSYLGCEYWPTVTPNPANPAVGTTFHFGVTIANPQNFVVNVTISGGGLATPRTVPVMPNTTRTETLPWIPAIVNSSTSLVARGGAYRLVSTAPVAVYQFNPLEFTLGGAFSYTNDASLLLPTHVLSGNYSVLSHNTWQTFGGFAAVVGTQATPTTVTVNLRAGLRAGGGVSGAAGGTVTQTLNQGDVLVLVAQGSAGTDQCTADDLTGSSITASAPVAVFGGHLCTDMPCSFDACDHLEEQLFPAETWGSSYVVSGLRERGASETSVIRVLSRTDGNALTFTGMTRPASCPATLNAGQFCEFEVIPDFQVSGSGPLLVGQFMVGQARSSGVGDPAMVLEVPTQQFRSNYIFNVPASYTTNFVTTVYPTGSPPRLDGSVVAAGTAVAGTTFSVSRFNVTPGAHTMTGAAPFGIKVTGTASYTSYMYPGGLDLNQLNAL